MAVLVIAAAAVVIAIAVRKDGPISADTARQRLLDWEQSSTPRRFDATTSLFTLRIDVFPNEGARAECKGDGWTEKVTADGRGALVELRVPEAATPDRTDWLPSGDTARALLLDCPTAFRPTDGTTDATIVSRSKDRIVLDLTGDGVVHRVTMLPSGKPLTIEVRDGQGNASSTVTVTTDGIEPFSPPIATEAAKNTVETGELDDWEDTPAEQPALPEGWKLVVAHVLPAVRSAEGCDQLHLVFADPTKPSGDYLELFEISRRCAGIRLLDGTPISGLPAGSTMTTASDGSFTADVVRPTSVVQVLTTLEQADVVPLLSSWSPVSTN